MLDVNTLLLLIAAYIRKTNHTTETDAEINAGVIDDIKKINTALNNIDLSEIKR